MDLLSNINENNFQVNFYDDNGNPVNTLEYILTDLGDGTNANIIDNGFVRQSGDHSSYDPATFPEQTRVGTTFSIPSTVENLSGGYWIYLSTIPIPTFVPNIRVDTTTEIIANLNFPKFLNLFDGTICTQLLNSFLVGQTPSIAVYQSFVNDLLNPPLTSVNYANIQIIQQFIQTNYIIPLDPANDPNNVYLINPDYRSFILANSSGLQQLIYLFLLGSNITMGISIDVGDISIFYQNLAYFIWNSYPNNTMFTDFSQQDENFYLAIQIYNITVSNIANLILS
jgi:hypothetical protein